MQATTSIDTFSHFFCQRNVSSMECSPSSACAHACHTRTCARAAQPQPIARRPRLGRIAPPTHTHTYIPPRLWAGYSPGMTCCMYSTRRQLQILATLGVNAATAVIRPNLASEGKGAG